MVKFAKSDAVIVVMLLLRSVLYACVYRETNYNYNFYLQCYVEIISQLYKTNSQIFNGSLNVNR